jgi:ribosomal protein S19
MSKSSAKKTARQKRKQIQKQQRHRHKVDSIRTFSRQTIQPTFNAEQLNVPAGLFSGFGQAVAKVFRLRK